MILITPNIKLNDNEIHLDFVRASGPGGQNVNKVATAVQLRFDAIHSPSLIYNVKKRLIRLAGTRITEDGILIIDARKYRTQERNRKDAMERLAALIRKAEQKPKPRKKTVPTEASKEKRLKAKHSRGETKQMRQDVDPFAED